MAFCLKSRKKILSCLFRSKFRLRHKTGKICQVTLEMGNCLWSEAATVHSRGNVHIRGENSSSFSEMGGTKPKNL